MRNNIENLSIIFTVRVDSMERFNNIKATLSYYSKFTSCPIIVLEADKEPQLDSFIRSQHPDINYIFIEDANAIFHRTHYINEEFKQVRTVHAAVIDSDVIVPINQLIQANNALLQEKVIMTYPYDGRFVGIDAYFSDLFRKLIDPEIFEIINGNKQLMFGFISVGGAFLVDINKYKAVGWENEYFPGWGPEDFEREHRLDILGHKPIRIEGVIYHLSHPRGINSSNSYTPLILATKREYCKVCSMMPGELRAYISTWHWLSDSLKLS